MSAWGRTCGNTVKTGLPKGYAIKRTIYGYVGVLMGINGPLWETAFDLDLGRTKRRVLAHWAETCADVDAAMAAIAKAEVQS